jgi:hypothetical protein
MCPLLAAPLLEEMSDLQKDVSGEATRRGGKVQPVPQLPVGMPHHRQLQERNLVHGSWMRREALQVYPPGEEEKKSPQKTTELVKCIKRVTL